MAAVKPGRTIPVETYKHDETRKNIPTEELREFAPDVEEPQTILWPRDTSLDPQLVWKGKDEQNRQDLAVPVVPVYIQEKIQPRAIIEDLRAVSKGDAPPQLSLFAEDFNGLEWDQLIDFYQHEQGWTNRMILGDSLLVMSSLAEKEGLRGKVQTIYMDPPYGIKFGSNWQASTANRDVKDGAVADVSQEPEVIRAFRDTWELGINSYLAYVRDRFVVARDLLSAGGSIFVQIGDENVHLVRSVLDEVFLARNFIALITFAKTTGFEAQHLGGGADYLLWYSTNANATKVRHLLQESPHRPGDGPYRWVVLADGTSRALTARELRGQDPFPESARLYRPDNILSQGKASHDQTFTHGGKSYSPGANSHWKAQFPDGMNRLGEAGRLHIAANTLQYVRFGDDYGMKALPNIWTDTLTGQFTDDKTYVVQTGRKVIERCLLMTTDPGDLILDPTGGSGTTAYVAEQWGRRWITIDTSRVSMALMRTRLMSGRFPYYVLADSEEGLKKEAELTGLVPPSYKTGGDLRKGFVYKRVPHVTLKSIANNPDIHEGMTREEIDDAIARHADTEILYDQPYEDNRKVRVTGPFTVESLSPHRVISDEVERTESELSGQDGDARGDFVNVVVDNLAANYVATTRKQERLRFTRLERFPGRCIHAEGDYVERPADEEEDAGTEGDGAVPRTVALSIGPEYGTVTSEQVKEAAKEAMRGAGYDLLLILGFAFDAHAAETADEFDPGHGGDEPAQGGFIMERKQRYGKLPVVFVRINPELWMGEGLLKKTGAGNLFTVFGEPDIEVPAEFKLL